MPKHISQLHADAGFSSQRLTANRVDGECPACGSKSAFQILSSAQHSKVPELGYYKCFACNVYGDAINWLQQFASMTFPEAAAECGLELKQHRPHRKKTQDIAGLPPVHGASTPPLPWTPKLPQWPDVVADPEAWQEHALKLINACHQALLARPSALAWLAARGVTKALVLKHRIGFHSGETVAGVEYNNSYRGASAWGMPALPAGQKKICIPAGLTIPCWDGDQPLRINVRTMAATGPKYRNVKGSQDHAIVQTIHNPGQPVGVVVESEFDAIALSALLPACTVIPMGSASVHPSEAANRELRHKSLILVSLDRDAAGIGNPTVGRIPGRPAPSLIGAEWWLAHYPQAQPWTAPAASLLPEGTGQTKDHGDAIKVGCDMAAWYAEALALYLPAPTFLPPRKKKIREGGGVSEEELMAFCCMWPAYAVKLLAAEIIEAASPTGILCAGLRDSAASFEAEAGGLEGQLGQTVWDIIASRAAAYSWADDPWAMLDRLGVLHL